MRIEKFVDFSTEIEIDLTSEDIHLILEESETLRGLLYNLGCVGQFLKAIPDKLIKEMNDKHREITVKFLEEVIHRIKNKGQKAGK